MTKKKHKKSKISKTLDTGTTGMAKEPTVVGNDAPTTAKIIENYGSITGAEKKGVHIVTNEELTSQHAILDAIETGDNACEPLLPPSHSTKKANDGVQHRGKTALEATGVVFVLSHDDYLVSCLSVCLSVCLIVIVTI
jgi:hypothetical protein